MHTSTPEAAQAIESSSRQFTHRLMIDWANNGLYQHELSDMSPYVIRTSRDQALSSTAPGELMLIEGNAAAALEIEVAGSYKTLPLTGHFAPYNGRSVFYSSGLDSALGARMYYDIAVWTDTGWEWFRQFTGVVREIESIRESGIVKISCLDNVELMRCPVRIPPYAMYKDYLINGFKRSQLVDSSSVIDLAARAAGFSSGPRGYDRYLHADLQQSNGKYAREIILKVPFHGSHLPEIGALDNEFEFHLTEQWEDGTAAEQARKEQFRSGPHGYLALNAVPRGKNSWAVKRYWPENMETFYDGDILGTTVLGTWIYWTGNGVDESSNVISIEAQHFTLQLVVEGSNGGVNCRLIDKGTDPDTLYDGNWLFLDTVGWHYIEAAFQVNNISGGSFMRTAIDGTYSAVKSHVYNSPGYTDYELLGLVKVENKYALSDLVVVRSAFSNDINTTAFRYDTTTYGNAAVSRGGNRITYTLRDDNQEAWEVAKAVAAAEFGTVFFDDHGQFRFWNYEDILAKQQTPVRSFDISDVSGLSIRNTMDSVRNTWQVTTRTGYSDFGIVYDFGRDGVPYWKDTDGQYYPLDFRAPSGQWLNGWIADKPTTVSTHPYLTERAEFGEWDDHGPSEGYKPYRGTDYVGDVDVPLLAYPRKTSRDWSQIRLFNTNGLIQGFIGPNDIKRFRIAGTVITEEEERNWQVIDETSRAKYGNRVIELKGNFWLQDRFQTEEMLESIISRIGRPIPVTDNITTPGDPRIQIGDLIEINDWEGMGETIRLQVLGIQRTFEDGSGLTDTYQVEVIEPPGQGIWDSASYGIWGQSFIWGA